jgi:hypothetical protein
MTVLPNYKQPQKRYKKHTNDDMSLTYEGEKGNKLGTRGDVFPNCTGNKHFDKLSQGGKNQNTQKGDTIKGNRKHEGGQWGGYNKTKRKCSSCNALFFSPFELVTFSLSKRKS